MNPTFPGTLFDGETLAATPVTLGLADGRIGSADGTTMPPVALGEIRVSDRLGNTPRYLYLPDGRTVETHDNEAVDTLLAGQRRGRLVALIHALETHSRVAAAGTVLLVATIGTTLWWGLPVLARRIALAMPAAIEEQAGKTALATVNQILAPSELSAAERNRVLAQLERLAGAAGLPATPAVAFRSMGGQFPNAFALPGGTIIVSDELVKLATNDELAAVLAHEIGHGQYRHGMQSVLRGSAALLVVSAVTGDLSALTSFAGTIPFLLLQRGYSREFEVQADAYAVELMRKAGIGVHHFASILKKLEDSRPKQGNDFTYLSTHPGTADRIKALGPAGATARPDAPAKLPRPEVTKELTFGAVDTLPEPLAEPLPRYPAHLRAANVSGSVTVSIVVDETGVVRARRIVKSSHKDFETAALETLASWKYNPGKAAGQVKATNGVVVFHFFRADE